MRIVELRAQRSLSQRALAKALGISPASVALYELGQRTPNLTNARRLSRFFGVTLEDLEFGPKSRPEDPVHV